MGEQVDKSLDFKMLSLYGYCVVTFLLLWQKQFKKGNILLWFSLLESPFITVGMSRNLIRLVAVRRKRTINTCVHYATEPLPHDLTGKMCYGCFHSVCASMLWVLSFCVYIHPCYESFRSVCASMLHRSSLQNTCLRGRPSKHF